MHPSSERMGANDCSHMEYLLDDFRRQRLLRCSLGHDLSAGKQIEAMAIGDREVEIVQASAASSCQVHG